MLERAAGAATVPEAALFSTHCASCGAPAPGPGKESGACLSCGTLLNDGARDWVLAGCHPWDSPEARLAKADGTVARVMSPPKADAADPASAGAASAPPHGPTVSRRLFLGVAAVAAADGTISPPERAVLDRLGARCGLRPDAVAGWIDAALQGGGSPPLPAGPDEARAWMEDLAAVALCDGNLDAGETMVIRRIAAAAGIPAEAERLLGRMKAEQGESPAEPAAA